MGTCFVVQPFDAGRFDKRYLDIFKPAIIAAGLEPYRVDEDPSADIPIESIEHQIRAADVCLADITLDNPNVWYELGFAFATGTPVVMVCGDERTSGKYPFDIQHRSIISYRNESLSDFEKLRTQITERISAALRKADAMDKISESDNVSPIEGLSQSELTVLAALATSLTSPGETARLWNMKSDVEKAGLTNIAFHLGLRRLRAKGMIELSEQANHYDDEIHPSAGITDVGWNWIDRNENLFVIRRARAPQRKTAPKDEPFPDDDIPF